MDLLKQLYTWQPRSLKLFNLLYPDSIPENVIAKRYYAREDQQKVKIGMLRARRMLHKMQFKICEE